MKILITFIFVIGTVFSNARTFYVDSSNGNNKNNGISPTTAWKTIEKVNIASLVTGDSVLFKRGGIFRGNLFPKSGSIAGNITYGAYGVGTKPKLLGSYQRNSTNNWTTEGGNIWETSKVAINQLGIELLPNPNLDNNISDWHKWDNFQSGASSTFSHTTATNEYYSSPGAIKLECINNGTSSSDLQVFTNNWQINELTWYKLTFYAKATSDFSIAEELITMLKSTAPFTNYSNTFITKPITITNTWQLFEIYLKTNTNATDTRLNIELGGVIPDNSILYLDNISLKECSNNPEFFLEDIGNIILNNESFCGAKTWNRNEMNLQGEFWYDSENNSLKMYSTTNPAEFYSNIEIARSDNLIKMENKSYIEIENLDLRYGGIHGIICINSHNIKIKDVDFFFIGGGILKWSTENERLGNGIQFWNESHDNIVERCTFNQVYDAAMSPQGISQTGFNVNNLIFRNNIVNNCEYSFEFWEQGENISVSNIFFENNTCLNAGGGWGHSQRPDPNGTHLMFFGNDAPCENFYIRNNIFYNSTNQGIRWYKLSNINDIILDYNCWYESEGSVATILSVNYEYTTQWEEYKTASGKDQNSIALNPLFEPDYSLQLNSPCIGTGIVLTTVTDDYFKKSRQKCIKYDIGAIAVNHEPVTEYVQICDGNSYFGETKSGVYTRVLTSTSGCDSIVTTNLTVNPTYRSTVEVEICEGESFKEWTETGVYEELLKSVSGCDSILTIYLNVIQTVENTEYVSICEGEDYWGNTTSGIYKRALNSTTGCDSIIYTNLTVNPVFEDYNSITICEGENYNGWSTTGEYSEILSSEAGCDSILTTLLTVIPNKITTKYVTICQGADYYGWSEAGTYYINYTSASGCDSIIKVNLTIGDAFRTNEDIQICTGESYYGWTETGQYTRTLAGNIGCDTIITTNLTVHPNYDTIEYITICQGENYEGFTSTTDFTRVLTSSTACDSVVTTYLTVNPGYNIIKDISICKGENYNGWSNSGIYYENLISVDNCDSITTINLTVNPIFSITENVSICYGSDYKGWNEAGTYKTYLKTTSGCDSIITTILSIIDIAYTSESITICNGDTYKEWSSSGTYQKTLLSARGCDSIVTTELIVLPDNQTNTEIIICPGESYNGWTEQGSYPVTFSGANGCDSISITNLSFLSVKLPEVQIQEDTLLSVYSHQYYQWFDSTGIIIGATLPEYIIKKSGKYYLSVTDENNCTNISEIVQAIFSSNQTLWLDELKYSIIPNPSTNKFVFKINSSAKNNLTLKLINSTGQLIEVKKVLSPPANHIETFNVSSLSKGIYHLIVISNGFQTSEKIVVQ